MSSNIVVFKVSVSTSQDDESNSSGVNSVGDS